MKTEDRRINIIKILNFFQEHRTLYSRERKEEKKKKSSGEFIFRASCDISSSNICFSNLL